MTLAEQRRMRRIETLAIVLGLLGVVVVAFARPHMEQPHPVASAVRG